MDFYFSMKHATWKVTLSKSFIYIYIYIYIKGFHSQERKTNNVNSFVEKRRQIMLIVVVLSMLAFIGPPFRTVTPTSPAGLALAGDDIITCMKKTNYVLNKIKSQKQINNYTIISRTRLKPLHVFFFSFLFFTFS